MIPTLLGLLPGNVEVGVSLLSRDLGILTNWDRAEAIQVNKVCIAGETIYGTRTGLTGLTLPK